MKDRKNKLNEWDKKFDRIYEKRDRTWITKLIGWAIIYGGYFEICLEARFKGKRRCGSLRNTLVITLLNILNSAALLN